jgi:hypothetical protein
MSRFSGRFGGRFGSRLAGRFMGGVSSLALQLLASEADGLAIDFTDASISIRDTTTTSNAWNAQSGDVQTFWRDRSFTSYASPSPKITRDSSGTWTFRPHNLITVSEKLNLSPWTKTRSSISADATTAPDGTTTADKLIEDSTAGDSHFASQTITVTNVTPYTWSVYAKAGERTWLTLYDSNSTKGKSFDLANGVVGSDFVGAPTSASITAVGSGWYRCSMTYTTAATTATLIHYLSNGDASAAYNGDGASGLYLWGGQLNRGPSALTYTKTQAHNLVLQSQTLDNASWANNTLTITANATAAPDGTTTAETLDDASSSGEHRIRQAVAFTSGLTYVFSCYVKNVSRNYVQLYMDTTAFPENCYANFDVATGVVGTRGAGATSSSITAVGNGWYRCSFVGTADATGSSTVAVKLVETSGATYDVTYTGSNKQVYAWGAQIELASSSPGKYVATTTAAVYESRYELPREWSNPDIVNLVKYSQEFDNAAWTASATTVSANAATAPDGTSTADRVTFTTQFAALYQAGLSGVNGHAYTFSMYLKNVSGNANVHIMLTSDGAYLQQEQITLTSEWQRFDITISSWAGAPTYAMTVGIQDRNAAGHGAIDVWGAQLEIDVLTPSTYVPTTSAAAASIGGRGITCLGALIEEARTNIALYARDLTQSAYTKTNATAALTATGVGGVANTASTLTASAANGTAHQIITSASAARSLSMFVKRRTGTGTVTIAHGAPTGSTLISNGDFASDTVWTKGAGWTISGGVAVATAVASFVDINQQSLSLTTGKFYVVTLTVTASAGTVDVFLGTNGSGAAISSVTLGAGTYVFRGVRIAGQNANLHIRASNGGFTGTIDNVSLFELAETDITSSINSSTWTRVSIANETITNPLVGIKLATSGDAVDIDYVQSEAGAFATSPIYTGSASVTRAADSITLATATWPWDLTDGTLYAKFLRVTGAGNQGVLGFGPSDTVDVIDGGVGGTVNFRMGNASGVDRATAAIGGTGPIKMAGSWENDTEHDIAANGTYSSPTAGMDAVSAKNTLYIGSEKGATFLDAMYIQQVMVLPRRMTQGQLEAVTT